MTPTNDLREKQLNMNSVLWHLLCNKISSPELKAKALAAFDPDIHDLEISGFDENGKNRVMIIPREDKAKVTKSRTWWWWK